MWIIKTSSDLYIGNFNTYANFPKFRDPQVKNPCNSRIES